MTEKTIDLHLLRCLDALLIESNVTLAADRLRMSQSGMSNALARLRELFDDPILIRAVKGMSPTPRALELAPAVRTAIDQLSGMLAGPVEFDPAKSTAEIRIAGTDGTISCALEPVIEELRATAPLMRFDITPLLHKRLQGPLETGVIDLALGVYPILSPTLYATSVVEDRLCCMVPRDSKHAIGEFTLERYLEADHAVVSAGVGYRSAIDTMVEQQLSLLGVERKIRLSAPYTALLALMVGRSNMVATITSMTAHMYFGWFPLVLRPLPFQMPKVTISMVWHERSRGNPALSWVRQKLKEGMLARLAQLPASLTD